MRNRFIVPYVFALNPAMLFVDTGAFEFPEAYPLKLRLKDMLEDAVDEKFFMQDDKIQPLIKNLEIKSAEPFNAESDGTCRTIKHQYFKNSQANFIRTGDQGATAVIEPIRLGNIYGEHCGTGYAGNVWDKDAISPTLMTMQGGNRQPMVIVKEPSIQRIDIPQTVKVRKYPVDCKALCECLRSYKSLQNITNREISRTLNVPLTKVEHWFRQDDCFAIPEAELWMDLKKLLRIETDEFDESVMTFEEKEGVYEKSERHYFADGIAPTLTSTTAGCEKILVRKSTGGWL